jgi:hypothetical protein
MSSTETARSVDTHPRLGTLDPALAPIRDFYAACRAAISRSDTSDLSSAGLPLTAEMEAP